MDKKIFYHPELDGLRFIAFMMVFIHHAPLLFDTPVLLALNQYGWMGVDLFLCLSAFLFARLLFIEYGATGAVSIKNFYVRRALRIWPLYFFFVGLMVLLTVSQIGWDWKSGLPLRIIGLALFVDNLLGAFLGYVHFAGTPLVYLAHLWTISYEEQFYAVIPWALRKLFGMTWRAKAVALGVTFALFSAIRAFLIYLNIPHPAIWVLPITHFESILGGLAVGLGLLDVPLKKIPAWALMILGWATLALVCVLPNANEIGWHLMLSYPLVGLGTSLLLYSVVAEGQWSVKKILQHRGIAYFGKISYGLYVYHFFAIYFVLKNTPTFVESLKRSQAYPLFVFVVALGFTLALAVASYNLLEKPFLRFKERFTSIQSRPL